MVAVRVIVPATVPGITAGLAVVGKMACVWLARTMYCRLRLPSEKRASPPSVPPAEETKVSVITPVISDGKGAPIVRPTAGCVVVPTVMDVAGVAGRLMVIGIVLVPFKPLASVAVNAT